MVPFWRQGDHNCPQCGRLGDWKGRCSGSETETIARFSANLAVSLEPQRVVEAFLSYCGTNTHIKRIAVLKTGQGFQSGRQIVAFLIIDAVSPGYFSFLWYIFFVQLGWKINLRGLIKKQKAWNRSICTYEVILQSKISN